MTRIVPPIDDLVARKRHVPKEEALQRLRAYPLLDAITYRRSRRFSRGAEMPGGGLKYESTRTPEPLTLTEEALLALAAAGVTGLALGDVPYQSGVMHEAGGGNVMAALTGRTGASADAVHASALFIISDEGTYLWKRPQDYTLDEVNDLANLARTQEYAELYARMRTQIAAERTTIAREVPFVFPFNKWSTNLPGSTYFLPVSDLTGMYINVILSAFDEQMRMFVVDERNNFQPAGIKRHARSRGGTLIDDPAKQRVIPILNMEAVIVEFVLAEQAFMMHNLSLMEQAIGLGGWTHFATATEVAWLEALGFRLGKQRLTQRLRAGWLKKLLFRVLGRDMELPFALGLTVEGTDLVKPFCPPYYKDMEEAVLAFLKFKEDNVYQAELRATHPGSWKDPDAIQASIPRFSDACIDATIDYCTYLYETYGRFPAHFGPLRTTLAHQAHVLDLDFYDQFYQPGAYTETQARHLDLWHSR